jgi:hypothetical protein
MKTKLITPLIIVACFALLAPMQAGNKDKSNHTITLVCSTGKSFAATPTTIDLNEAKGVVTIHYGAIHNPGSQTGLIPEMIRGPLAARFTKNTITFVDHPPGNHGWDFAINRLTGIIEVIETIEGQKFPSEWTCHVGNAQF